MSVLTKFFKKKKKTFHAKCDISKEPVEKGFGYLLTTADVVQSKKYWDNIMTEPETMSYTINHFKNGDTTATQIRKMLFEKFSEVEKPWIVSDTYISWFNVDKTKAREAARNWWETEGGYRPKNTGRAEELLSADKYREIREYAIMEAGRDKVRLKIKD